MRAIAISAIVLFISTLVAPAQDKQKIAPPDPGFRPPQLLIHDGNKSTPLTLAKADINVLINGYIAQTTMTLTFQNDNDRVLEGELNFPLPEGTTISGYGLDIKGQIVDGVAVEKQKARVSYEKELRKGVDPGLVEHAIGNNFKTRVYPIPARGTRTIKVQYESDVLFRNNAAIYTLPLNWGDQVSKGHIKIEVLQGAGDPEVQANVGRMVFEKQGDRYIAERSFENVKFIDDLSVRLPAVAHELVSVEKRQTDDGAKTEHFFVINDQPDASKIPDAPRSADRVAIVWDASLSRAEVDKKRELNLLAKLLARLGASDVDLFTVRNDLEGPKSFHLEKSDAKDLLAHIQSLTYDGGTNFSAIHFVKNRADLVKEQAQKQQDYGCWMLFSDGLSNIGPDTIQPCPLPLYCISNDAAANHSLLTNISRQSSGAYFNLHRMSDDQVLAGIGSSPFSFISAEVTDGKVDELFPNTAQPITGRFFVTGKLLTPTATIKLKYGTGQTVANTTICTLKQDGATSTGLVSRFWAQQKIANLSMQAEKNDDELARIGKEFNIVTPNTSLLVLETLDQYLTYKVAPPRTSDLYKQYMEKVEQQSQQARTIETQKIDHVVQLWQQRVKWWEQNFEYAKDFKYKGDPKGSNEPGDTGIVSGTVGGLTFGAQSLPSGSPVGNAGQVTQNGQGQAPPPPPPASSLRRRVAPEGAGNLAEPSARDANTPRADSPESGAQVVQDSIDKIDGIRAEQENLNQQLGRRLPVQRLTGGLRPERASIDLRDEPSGFVQGKDTDKADLNIQIKPWNPATPYLQAMKAAAPEKAYDIYLEQRNDYAKSPAFYLDCADFLLSIKQEQMGIRVLTNVAELELQSPPLLRIVAHRLNQIGQRDLAINLFEKILKLRPEEPQSYRDLALALVDRADSAQISSTGNQEQATADQTRALELLHKVVMNHWDRFDEIETIALMEANRILAKTALQSTPIKNPFDSRLIKNLDVDVRILLTWDADLTDIDLWVVEPSGEKCFYRHNRTTIGGAMSRDFTQGYGPEEYVIHKSMPGTYKIQANFYGSNQQSLTGPTTVQATVITNFGRPDEKRQAMTLRLAERKEVVDIGEIKIEPR